ncbi:MAG: hypothetical protein WAN81_04860 [Candidatus Binataceae bacterium]
MNSSKTKIIFELSVPVAPILSANAAALMDLWKAQMAWTAIVGLPRPSLNKSSSEKTVDLEDLLK